MIFYTIFLLIKIFFNTAISRLQLIGKTDEARLSVKQNWAASVLNTLGFKIKIVGFPPVDSDYILVGNHISFLDIPLLMSALPQTTFIAKDDLKKWPIIGSAAAEAGTIFINRNRSASSEMIQKITDNLNSKNKKIAVFPSGTTTLNEQKPWKKGIFNIAKKNNTAIQLFHLSYNPHRESAYIDDDNLLKQLVGLLRLKNKTATLTWLEQFQDIDQPQEFAEMLRRKVSMA